MRVLVRAGRMTVRVFAMLLGGAGVRFRFVVPTGIMMVRRLAMMMRGCLVVGCGIMMMLARGVLIRCHSLPLLHRPDTANFV